MLYSDEYYAAQKAKRRSLGLINFIGELFDDIAEEPARSLGSTVFAFVQSVAWLSSESESTRRYDYKNEIFSARTYRLSSY